MANFCLHPSRKTLSSQIYSVNDFKVTLAVDGGDFGGADLSVKSDNPSVEITPEKRDGDIRVYTCKIVNTAMPPDGTEVFVSAKITAIGSSGAVWDSVTLRFDFVASISEKKVARKGSKELVIEPATNDFLSNGSLWYGDKTPKIETLDTSTYLCHPSKATLNFLPKDGSRVEIALFKVEYDVFKRVFILAVPAGLRPDSIAVVIPHTFGQDGVLDHFKDPYDQWNVVEHCMRFLMLRTWVAQLLAATNRFAILMPVRSVQGGSQLGPFVHETGLLTRCLGEIAKKTGVGLNNATIVIYSSGIYDANQCIEHNPGLDFRFGCNQDPPGGVPLSAKVGFRRQYISGWTTGHKPKVGFDYLPFEQWCGVPGERFVPKYYLIPKPTDRWASFRYMHQGTMLIYPFFNALQKIIPQM